MNLVIIVGEIISEVNFRFIYDVCNKKNKYCKDSGEVDKYKHISIGCCNLKLNNGSIISIYGYDNIADLMIRKLNIGDLIMIEGRIDSNGKVEIFDNI